MNQPGSQFLLNDKKFIVTGAASGIGRSTAITLAGLGAAVLLVDMNESALKETQAQCGNKSEILVLDLTDSDAVKTGIIKAVEGFGKLNGLVHCAGIPYISPLKTIDKTKALKVYEINSYAALELAKVFINRNVFSGSSGSIVFISSVYGVVGSAANVGYAMSKSAIHGLTKALSIELAPKGIRVNCVAPGFVKTPMMDDTSGSFDGNYNAHLISLHPLGLGNAEDVANPVAFLLSDAAKWITGTIVNVDGGFTAQ